MVSLVVATGVILSIFDGGFTPTAWYAAALFLLCLLAVVTALEPAQRGLPGAVRGGLLAYGLFVLFNYLSILWADAPGDAWDGANRALLYGLGLVLVATRPWSRQAGAAALAIAGFGIAAIALGVHLVAIFGAPLDLFLQGRLSEPTGYANAAASLTTLSLASSPWPVTGVPAPMWVPGAMAARCAAIAM